MLLLPLLAVAIDYRWHDLPPFDPPRAPLPVFATLSARRTRAIEPFRAAQAKAFHGIRQIHGFTRGSVGVRFRY